MKFVRNMISVILALLMILPAVPAFPVWAEDGNSEWELSGHYEDPGNSDYSFDWKYDEDTDVLYLDGKIIGSIEFYDENDEYMGTDLPLYFEYEGETALFDYPFSNVVFSSNVEELEEYCLGFDSYSGRVLNVFFEANPKLTYIDSDAFHGYAIRRIELPSSVEEIEGSAFKYANIDYLSLPRKSKDDWLMIYSGAFRNASIGTFDFNNCYVETIPGYAFAYSYIGNITLPNTLLYIIHHAFYFTEFGCDIVIPESVKTIDTDAFNHASFQKITFERQVPSIGARAFAYTKTAKASYYSYNIEETNVSSNAFYESEINVSRIEPVDDSVDFEHHSVSGFFDTDDDRFDLTWSYDAPSDTLYLDAQGIKIFNANGLQCLPLYYENSAGKEVLWNGIYRNVVFSKNVRDLYENCLGIIDWEHSDAINVSFENGSKLERISDYAFRFAKVSRLEIPDSCYFIGQNAFAASTLRYVKLPAFQGNGSRDKMMLGIGLFEGCENIEVDFNNMSLKDLPDDTFNGATISNIILPEGLENIGNDAFYGATLNFDIHLPDSVKNIYSAAFAYTNLKNVYLSKSLKHIYNHVFSKATIDGNVIFDTDSSDIVIDDNAFAESDIKTFNFNSNIKSIGQSVFQDCKKLKTVTADDDCVIETIGNYAFYNCGFIESVEIPDSVKTIGTSAFYMNVYLTNISIGENSNLESIGSYAFWGCQRLTSFTFPDSLKRILDNSFYLTKLQSLDFGENSNLEYIGAKAFSNCTTFTTFEIPKKLTTISASAFAATAIRTITHQNGAVLNYIGNEAFWQTPLVSVDLPDTVGFIGAAAFKNCRSLKTLNIPASLTTISDQTFQNDALLETVIPNTVTAVGESAFSKCEKITSIPKSLTLIESRAFENSGIVEVDFSGTTQSFDIGSYAFSACNNLKRVNLSNSNVQFDANAFKNCHSLKTVLLSEATTSIPTSAFENSGIESIVLPDTINYIYDTAFAGCENLKSINIPSKVKKIDASAFNGCISLETVDFAPNSSAALTLGYGAFYKCSSLSGISLPDNITAIPDYCFGESGIEQINLPSRLKTIGEYAFYESNLYEIIIPDNVTKIGSAAFEGCANLRSVYMSDNSKVEEIEYVAFDSCGNLTDFYFGNAIKTIGQEAFNGCNLKSLRLPSSVTSVGKYAFADNNELKTVILLSKKISIGINAFFYDSSRNAINPAGAIIYGYSYTDAKGYATNHNISFVPIDSVDDPENIDDFGDIGDEIYETFGTWQNGGWSILNEDVNVLYISGSGDFVTYGIYDSNGNRRNLISILNEYEVKRIKIADGITSIPANFLHSETPTSVELVRIPNSLTSIGAHAFDGSSIKAIYNDAHSSAPLSGWYSSYIPQSVTHIGEYAFANTPNLGADFELPKDLTEIPEGLFYNSGVPNVSMYGKVTKIGKKAFAECSRMTSLYIPCSVTEFCVDNEDTTNNSFGWANGRINGNLWVLTRKDSEADKYCKALGIHTSDYYGMPYRKGYLSDYSTPQNVTDSSQFVSELYWEYYIEDNLVVLNIKGRVNEIRTNGSRLYEFNQNSDKYAYVSSAAADSPIVQADKLIIDGISKWTAPNVLSRFNPSEISIKSTISRMSDNVFANCTRVKEILLPEGLTVIGEYGFKNCKSLERVRLGYGISTIPEGLFYECRNIEVVDLGNVVLQNIEKKAFYNCNSLKFVKLSNQTVFDEGYIGDQAFYNCVNLQEIFIPENIKTIGKEAFYNCVQAQSITIGSNVESVGEDAFAKLLYCEEINIDSNTMSSEHAIFRYTGDYTNGAVLNIKNDVETVDGKFFKGCNISEINLGKSVKNFLNKKEFASLREINVDAQNSTFNSQNKCLYNNSSDLLLVPQMMTEVTVAPGTRRIDEFAFYRTSAKHVDLPDSVLTLGESAFASSDKLIGVNLSSSVKTISKNCFKDCTKLRLFDLPERIIRINESAFEGCTNLASVIFNEGLVEIGEKAFKGCTKLMGLTFPEDLSTINSKAFADCSGLKYAYIWHTNIANDAFENCEKLNIFTPVGTDAYRYAREFDIPYSAYTDEELFFDEWAIKVDALAGYLGYCEEDGHGDIQYLTVYEADCENDGFVIGVCEYCSEILEEIHIDAYSHNYKLETQIPPTNTTRGISVYTCENCNRSFTNYSDPLDSNYEVEEHSVSGNIVLSSNAFATAGVSPAKNVSVVINGMTVATTDKNGYFSFDIETGTYEAYLNYAYGFTRKIYLIVEDDDIVIDKPIAIIGCDFNKDGVISEEDKMLFQMIISAKKDDPSYLAFVDLNNDGYINAKDMLYITGCMGLNSSRYKYPTLIF